MFLRRFKALLIAGLVAAATLAPSPARAEELPPRNHALLLLRVLAYDRNLKARAGSTVTVLILTQAGDRASEERGAELAAAFEEVAKDVVVAGLAVRVKEAPYHDPAELEARLNGLHPALVYLDGALTGAAAEVAKVTRRHAVCTSGTRAMAEAGLAVGVAARQGRAALVVNLAASRSEGVDFDASLLAISEVIRE
jgi:YfiR/HmsC-like